jgi:hypothetical protein
MHTFIRDGDVMADAMLAQCCRRLQFLARKMVEDLARADKIFVFKLEGRNLTRPELHALHQALYRYGENTLLYVRYSDHKHPPGTVHVDEPGVLIGYVDHFGYTPDFEKRELAIDDWVSICRRAHDLWRKEDTRSAFVADVPNLPDDSQGQQVR